MNWSQNGAELIEGERERQKREEGWSEGHDDDHEFAELTDAAICYARLAALQVGGGEKQPDNSTITDEAKLVETLTQFWPWNEDSFKPSGDPIKNLVRAGALIAAEIDRIQREG